ncbi:hypothetical protein TSOC_014177 [Tetrabaena socialis]|uniref:F-box domain-containing protein n=1 Tax=Tetrabaena socialis TaxID=47790 RepID=A0A2J7ZIC4_9CHLO|nr:hypothetical protein TSOC_014177 [Tetrabaena socialis]|eukprot:PNH00022.1 hypothetical protein TSOC_014177 [Tetrabaena socialis]
MALMEYEVEARRLGEAVALRCAGGTTASGSERGAAPAPPMAGGVPPAPAAASVPEVAAPPAATAALRAARTGAGAGSHSTGPPLPPAPELPPDLLQQVLRRCDRDTLVGVVPLVCRAWRTAQRRPEIWREHLASPLMAQLDPLLALGPPLSLPRLYLIMQGRNFLRNPSPQELALVTTTVMGDGVAWEAPPAGIRSYCDAVTGLAAPPPPLPYPGSGPRLVARVQAQLQSLFGNGSGGFGNGSSGTRGGWEEQQQGCLATANDWCEVVQVVDLDWELQRRGLPAAQAANLLDAGLSLRLSVHVGSRWDCVGQYSVGLLLDEGNCGANGYGYANGSDGTDDSIPCLQSFVMRPTRHHFYLGRACCTSDTWSSFQYTVPACPRGFRRAIVMLRGRRAPNSMIVSPMPRFCGAKFAAAELVFV